MKTSPRPPHAKHLAFRDAMIATMREHGTELPAEELLAVAAHFVGQLIALQDQRTMTRELAMQIVSNNIEQGNMEVIAGLITKSDGTA